jgi:hypothetical protein
LGANRGGTERVAATFSFSLLTALARFRSPKSRAIEENENIFEEQSTLPLWAPRGRRSEERQPDKRINAARRAKFHPARR